jgi:uncharacterized membrane protein YbaN (DUF454 family)
MLDLKKKLWFLLGIIFVGIAFVGVYVPGLPWSTPTVIAAYCFSKSSDRMHRWLYNHRIFGPFLTGWTEKRIFPTKFKYFMLVTMSSSLVIMWFTTGNINAILWTGAFMIGVAVWGWRYPGSEEEYNRRKEAGERIAWIK